MNYALIVYDSCRYDSMVEARTPNLDRLARVHRAYTHGTFTLPAHVAMLSGFLPHCAERLPFYNRFVKQLWRQGTFTEPSSQHRAAEKVLDGENIVVGFRKDGYYTIGTGAPAWFSLPAWRDWFDDFCHSAHPGYPEQIAFLRERRGRWSDRPLFLFACFSETHEPYVYEGCGFTRDELPRGRHLHRLGEGPLSRDDFEHLRRRQIEAAEYLDAHLPEVLELLPHRTKVVLTSDHGECFGEDGLYGHTQYHPKVMEVPISIFEI